MALPSHIGKYRVEKILGQGGMGTVYLAHDEGIDRRVAIKLLRADDEVTRRRFRSEARSIGRLKHPHIITVYDYSEFEGRPCIVMEYVDGDTLAALIKRADPVPDVRKLQLIEQVCQGLGYAHRAGIVHRDIKPSNLMIDNDGAIKIVDFGIAKTEEKGPTWSGKAVGTLAYMAPEQIQGVPVDRRCDIFAVGVVLFEFLTGNGAFPGDSDFSIVTRIVNGEPEPFQHQDSAFTELIVPVIDCALAKEPDQRFEDADRMAAALADVRARWESRTKRPKTVVLPRGTRFVPPGGQESVETVLLGPGASVQVKPATVPVRRVPPSPAASSQMRATESASVGPTRWRIAVPAMVAIVVVVGLATAYLPSRWTRQSAESPGPSPTSSANVTQAPAEPVSATVSSLPPADVQPPVAPPPPTAEKAEPVPDPVAPASPPSDAIQLSVAARLFESGDYAGATSAYQAVLARDPRNAAAIRGLLIVGRAVAAKQRRVSAEAPPVAPDVAPPATPPVAPAVTPSVALPVAPQPEPQVRGGSAEGVAGREPGSSAPAGLGRARSLLRQSRAEVTALIGLPSSTGPQAWFYDSPNGTLTVEFQGAAVSAVRPIDFDLNQIKRTPANREDALRWGPRALIRRTRAEVAALLGKPSFTDRDQWYYDTPNGSFTLEFQGPVVSSVRPIDFDLSQIRRR